MLRPKIPTMPQPTGLVTPPAVIEPTAVVQHTPAAPAPAPATARPTVQLTPGAVIALVGSGTAVVLVVGAVLVSMLLAVAITGASVAICALVIRSLIASEGKRR
ncbi:MULTISPECIES: SpdD-like protein [unclassified Streptomyces]|uniref:SpdD-like protein n=1 Tax=unclassified Streptomyces TaxID=2593676 RepID=UPI002E811327|nr:SpdD-like protein [Streptomyces sp. NBC_00589]WTI39126.1 SpdD-like protein [Streptomyces sp. NBC_00775]WUB27195.1 SpdD-like protein [Streptomyces sp. NBC_00589]